MQEFNNLLKILETLLGTDGCDWDRKQTIETLQVYLVEEMHELLEAIDEKDDRHILDEAGDVLHCILFISKIAEKQKRFNIKDILKNLSDKLVRRHPHVFADIKVNSLEEIKANWDKIKKIEKKDQKNNLSFGISKNMPLMIYAQKIIQKMKRNNLNIPHIKEKFETQDDFEKDFLKLVIKAENSEIHIENAFRKFFNSFIKKITGDDLEA